MYSAVNRQVLYCTVVCRYSAVRRQGEPRGDGLEPRVLDYRTQQAKVALLGRPRGQAFI
jgi:hypothetical protein